MEALKDPYHLTKHEQKMKEKSLIYNPLDYGGRDMKLKV